MMKELGVALRNMRDLIASCEPCPEKVAMQARFDLMVKRLKDYPRRVAVQAPFADAKEAEKVLRDEMEFVLAAMDAPLPH
jgi:hypothetical protein